MDPDIWDLYLCLTKLFAFGSKTKMQIVSFFFIFDFILISPVRQQRGIVKQSYIILMHMDHLVCKIEPLSDTKEE